MLWEYAEPDFVKRIVFQRVKRFFAERVDLVRPYVTSRAYWEILRAVFVSEVELIRDANGPVVIAFGGRCGKRSGKSFAPRRFPKF